ncbi:MAG TPA: 50S ribosomal protein L16 [Candidatus Omnitrophica bacterium]|nr:MAG: 50S ribosomal protein L16 [Candidatus Omnitrophota bacterium]RKY42723.1 MAG: 50S ribosomal protein L16 [Candidatus Omnitrophota bacterium]HEC69088.1 50S ribosomal protein L16 [Candidatus Omnitrophota bacterium]
MAFIPSRVKYRKAQRGRRKGLAVSGCRVSFGEYGLKALGCGTITNKQLEMIRIIMSRALRKGGKFWIRIFSDKPVTKKPAETRMGKGKGDVDCWEAKIKRGKVLFEIGGVPRDYAQKVLRDIAYKLPFKCRFVER